MDSLIKALRYFDGESGLDNMQVKYFLKKAFDSRDLIKKNIIKDLCSKIFDSNYDWRDYLKNLKLINCIEEFSQEQIKEYILDLVCDHILSIE
jgi:hypothetical protein